MYGCEANEKDKGNGTRKHCGCEANEKDKGNGTRKHCGENYWPVTEQGVWRIRKNQELGVLRQTCDMVTPTKIKSLE